MKGVVGADVDIVRRNLGKDEQTSADWALEHVRRSDINRDGKVDMNDLLLVIVAYEASLG